MYVVPDGTISVLFVPPPLLGVCVIALPEQTSKGTAAIDGLGSTVITTLNGVPAHEPEVGVTT